MVMGACLLLFPLPLDRVLGCTRFLHRARVSQLLGTAEGLVVEFDPEMQVRAVLYHPELVSDEVRSGMPLNLGSTIGFRCLRPKAISRCAG